MVGLLGKINTLLDAINGKLDVVLPWVLLAALMAYPIWFCIKGIIRIRKEDQEEIRRGLLFETLTGTLILSILFGAIYLAFWYLPDYLFLPDHPNWFGLVITIRWLVIFLPIIIATYYYGHKNGGYRWIMSLTGLFITIYLGYLVHYWVGILLISLPILAIYYCFLYDLASAVLPSSSPEDRTEKWKKFLVLVAYSWGFQRPLIVVEGHAWEKPDTRVKGNIGHAFPSPGMVWMRSHQVAGITSGTKFKRVDGPGLIFTGKKEEPLQILDLRPQIRTSEIDVISQDGIGFKTRIGVKFRLDPEPWDQKTVEKLSLENPIFSGADMADPTLGSFPFSSLRVQAAIGVTSSDVEKNVSVFWDQWALGVIEHETRQVIAQKKLEELWQSQKDVEGDNALDAIAGEIRQKAIVKLRLGGIQLTDVRLMNFSFPSSNEQPDGITEQQISNWGSEWERKRAGILAEAQADAERSQQKAHAYAETLLLKSIADGLREAEKINPALPPFVIAMRFLRSLQELVHQQSVDEEGLSESTRRINEIQRSLRDWKSQYSSFGKEKQS
jgi:hypothetical protein